MTDAAKATPRPWKWAGEDYRGGWGWQLLVGPNDEGVACGQAADGPYKHLRAFVPIEAKFCKTGFYADSESAPGLHIQEADAAFLLRAVNSHDDLVAAVNEILPMCGDVSGDEETQWTRAVLKLRAALAKARPSMSRFREAIEAARRVVELIRDDNPKAPLTTHGKDIVTACRYLLTLADAQDDLTALAEGRGMTKDAQTVTPTAEDRETARKLSWSFPAGDNDSGDREQLADEIAIALATLRAQMQARLSAYETRIPLAPEHLAKLPLPTGDYEADLAAMADAITDDMRPKGPPTWGFVQWELAPPDYAVALFSLEAGLIERATTAEAALERARAALQKARDHIVYMHNFGRHGIVEAIDKAADEFMKSTSAVTGDGKNILDEMRAALEPPPCK